MKPCPEGEPKGQGNGLRRCCLRALYETLKQLDTDENGHDGTENRKGNGGQDGDFVSNFGGDAGVIGSRHDGSSWLRFADVLSVEHPSKKVPGFGKPVTGEPDEQTNTETASD